MKRNNYAAIIIAAGFSSRMDGFKPLLKFGNETAVEKVVNTHLQAGTDEIILVLGYQAEAIRPFFEQSSIKLVVNEDFKDGMYTSITRGVSQLSEAADAFFIHPVDIPLVRKSSLSALMEAFETAEKGIIYPCFGGKRGHPPLIHRRYRNAIINHNGDGGLKNLLAKYETAALDLPLADQSVLKDMDTRTDYQALLDYAGKNAPNPGECEALLDIYKTPIEVRKHSQKVKAVAMTMARQLTGKGVELDTDSLAAAALLHDLVKAEKQHPEKAAVILKESGYDKIGKMISTHMDIEVTRDEPINEREILYLADKLVQNDRCVPLGSRKAATREKFLEQPEVLKKIDKRYGDAEMIAQKIKTIIGKAVWDE